MVRWRRVFATVGILVSGVLFFAVVAFCGVAFSMAPPDPVHEGNFKRIQPGMTEDQVQHILGERTEPPPLAREDNPDLGPERQALMKKLRAARKTWQGKSGEFIAVIFNEDGTVHHAEFIKMPGAVSPIQRIYRLLGF